MVCVLGMLYVISTGAGAISAWYWFRSSRIKYEYPPIENEKFVGSVDINPAEGVVDILVDGRSVKKIMESVRCYAENSSFLNSMAAIFAAIAVLAGGIASIVPFFI